MIGRGFFREERGILWMDALMLACILAAMAGCMHMYRTSAQLRQENALQTTAIYLAESELDYLEATEFEGNLHAGSYDWLGLPEDLAQHGGSYEVRADVEEDGAAMWHASVVVTWTFGSRSESIRMERLMRHEKKNRETG
ncbi:MAG: hypothetical protein IJQ78_00295 [Selenomonadaceae bacterium]|nr:hypothetical protein [Selenomonadaceae bacterium]